MEHIQEALFDVDPTRNGWGWVNRVEGNETKSEAIEARRKKANDE